MHEPRVNSENQTRASQQLVNVAPELAMKHQVERAVRIAADHEGKNRHDDFARPTRVLVESLKPCEPRPDQSQPQQRSPDDRDDHIASADRSMHVPNAGTRTGRIQNAHDAR